MSKLLLYLVHALLYSCELMLLLLYAGQELLQTQANRLSFGRAAENADQHAVHCSYDCVCHGMPPPHALPAMYSARSVGVLASGRTGMLS